MDDLVQAVVDEVLRRQGQRPALLVGRAPQAAAGWRFVTDGPYEAVILGSLTAARDWTTAVTPKRQTAPCGRPCLRPSGGCAPSACRSWRRKAPSSRRRRPAACCTAACP